MGGAIGTGKRVLLVEDDPIQAKLARAYLHDAGFRVFVAGDASSAMRIAATRSPDIVLSDVLMRDTDGFTLCRSLRTAGVAPHVPVVLMSAHFQHEDDRALASAVGADALVERTPGFVGELAALNKALSGRDEPAEIHGDAERLYQLCITKQLSTLLSRAEHADARLRMIFRHSQDALLIFSNDGSVLEANERARVLLERGQRTLIGSSAVELGLGLSPFHFDVTSEEAEVLTTLRRPDGAQLHLALALTRVPHADRELVVCIGRDITERVETQRRLETSERQYRTLVENMPDVVWTMGVDGTTRFVSRNIGRVCGYTLESLDRRDDSFWTSRVHDEDRARCKRAWDSLALEGSFSVEYRFRHQSGVWLWLHERATLRAADPDGTIDGLLSDVSERKRLELQLIQSQKMEALGLLTGGIAHDFNNVLAVVLGNAQFMLDEFAEADPRREGVLDIQRSAQRAAHLTRQLLAFARRQHLEPAPLDLNEVLIGVEKMLHHVVRENVVLEVRRASALGIVRADIGQLEQVLMNLAVNARDAMPKGGTLLVETENVELDREYAIDHDPIVPGRYVMLAVSDTGIGMDAETRRRAFEPFFTTKGANGTGLGLASTYGIVKQSGGFIWVYSEPGHGTTFRIYLPRIDAVAAPLERPVRVTPQRGTETVLLVEDDPSLRAALRRMIMGLGYSVLLASNAEEAVTVVESYDRPIHVTLTDVMLPGANGVELAVRLHELRADMKVVLMSGYTDIAAQRIAALERGVPFLQKPFAVDLLARRLREVLGPGVAPELRAL